MGYDKGGIKTNILLVSLLLTMSLLLFFFVQSIYAENKVAATEGLYNVNSCIDLRFDVLNMSYDNNHLSFVIKNNPDSIKIEKITIRFNDERSNQNLDLNLGESKKIIFENITLNQNFQIYMNGCNEIVKTIYI